MLPLFLFWILGFQNFPLCICLLQFARKRSVKCRFYASCYNFREWLWKWAVIWSSSIPKLNWTERPVECCVAPRGCCAPVARARPVKMQNDGSIWRTQAFTNIDGSMLCLNFPSKKTFFWPWEHSIKKKGRWVQQMIKSKVKLSLSRIEAPLYNWEMHAVLIESWLWLYLSSDLKKSNKNNFWCEDISNEIKHFIGNFVVWY